jgi:predicted GIY-YIG superfamily endonuclease
VTPSSPLADAAVRAPPGPGVYLFLGDAADVLYVGKAANLRRRVQQHASAGPPTSHLHARYELVREVRWEVASDEEAAAWREADLIFALRPPFNAESGPRSRGSTRIRSHRAPFLGVTAGDGADLQRFAIASAFLAPPAHTYGCFPHLGKGVSSRLGITCSDGYVAFLRLLWAASGRGTQVPNVITRSVPETFDVAVDASRARPVHDFLSGVSARLLDDMAEAVAARPAYMQPALARDRDAARGFFAAGPRHLRARRRRHHLPAGAIAPDVYRALVIAEVRDAVGDFALPNATNR